MIVLIVKTNKNDSEGVNNLMSGGFWDIFQNIRSKQELVSKYRNYINFNPNISKQIYMFLSFVL